ncbi:MAG: glycosyl hydrolase [Armatimonadota bacterium]
MRELAFFLTATTLFFVIGGTVLSASSDSIKQMRDQFVNPDNNYRALPMCSFDFSKIPENVKTIRDAGWGGINFQFPNWGPAYLENPEDWNKFTSAINECKKNNLIAWIYDERAYPSGKAGTLVLKDHPEFEAQGLFYSSSDYSPVTEEKITFSVPEGLPFYAVLFKLSKNAITGVPLDLTSSIRDGKINVTLQPGNWRIMAFVQNRLHKGTHSDILGERYVNLMDPRATDRFIDVTHEAYYSYSGDAFGKTIKAFFTDEPSLMGGYLKEEDQEYPVLSWYEGLPAAFKSECGYDIKEALPSIFSNTGPDTVKKRSDVYQTIANLTADNFFGRIQDWCKAHNVASGGHLVWEESLIYHANFYGNIMTSLAKLDIPGIDVLGCNYGCTSGSRTEGGPVTPKLISSSAHLYDRERTCSESFCFVTKDVPLDSMIAHVAWQWVLGINTLTTLSTQQEHAPDVHRKLNDYTGKLSYMLTQGEFVADTAVLYPIASVWADFKPTNRPVWELADNPGAKKVDDEWQGVTRELLACQRDFDYVDESNIDEAKISKGSLIIGKCKYKTLVLPNVTTMRITTLQKIKQFVDSGGTVISCGDIPSKCADSVSTDNFDKLVNDIWGDTSKNKVFKLASFESLYSTFAKLGDADLYVSPKNADIYYQHRSQPKTDIYFIVNNAEKPVSGDFTFRATGKAEVWDPMTSAITSTNSIVKGKKSTVNLTVPPRNGVFVVFSR